MKSIFYKGGNCPFCECAGRRITTLRYSETAEANPEVEDIEGSILDCESCGIAFPNIAFDVSDFVALYAKTLGDLTYFDQSILQRVRRACLSLLIRAQSQEPLSAALQIPIHHAIPLRLLDVGCGFGEFGDAYSKLGAIVTATEVLPQLVGVCTRKGIDCRLGQLERIEFGTELFDLILLRAVLYRTQSPRISLTRAKSLLAQGGMISVVDPCVDRAGVEYFARKQFPQGRYYIQNVEAFGEMLHREFGLRIVKAKQIYGRPNAPLKKVGFWGNILGFGELLVNNALKRKPYMLAYLLQPVETGMR